jgi:hypothetical protein
MKPIFSRIGTVFAALSMAAALAAGCNQGDEGDRCNPSLSHDECGAGLSCQQPVDCAENYCCPTSGSSSNPYCQPGCNGGQASICAAGGDADCDSGSASSSDAGGDGEGEDGGGSG